MTTKANLIDTIKAANPHLNTLQIYETVTVLLETIGEKLAEGKKIEIRGFGTFSVGKTAARVARNIHTGEKIHVKASKTARVKFSEKFKSSAGF